MMASVLRVIWACGLLWSTHTQNLDDKLGEVMKSLQSIQKLLQESSSLNKPTTKNPALHAVPGIRNDSCKVFEDAALDEFTGPIMDAFNEEKLQRRQLSDSVEGLNVEMKILNERDQNQSNRILEIDVSIQEIQGNIEKLVKQVEKLSVGRRKLVQNTEFEKLSKQFEVIDARVHALEEILSGVIQVTQNVNIALLKTASQSSDYTTAFASRAVDGNINQDYSGGSCTHTVAENKPWWMVDFGNNFPVAKVVIYNRKDCCGDRLRNFEVTVSKSEGKEDYVMFAKFEGTSHDGEVLTLENSDRPIGRFLKVQLLDNGLPLTICEIKVYSLI